MAYSANTIFGGFADPEATGYEAPGTTLNAVNEYENFADQISINLNNEVEGMPPYGSINNVITTFSLSGIPLTSNEITANGSVALNLTYTTPTTSPVSGLNITTSYNSTSGNVYISGNISGAFPDSYWEYKDRDTDTTYSVVSPASIPDGNIGLYLYKPSFMRYTDVVFTIRVEYDTANSTYEVRKKIVNNWDINRLALLSQISRENN